jgi:hypothetical protein
VPGHWEGDLFSGPRCDRARRRPLQHGAAVRGTTCRPCRELHFF